MLLTMPSVKHAGFAIDGPGDLVIPCANHVQDIHSSKKDETPRKVASKTNFCRKNPLKQNESTLEPISAEDICTMNANQHPGIKPGSVLMESELPPANRREVVLSGVRAQHTTQIPPHPPCSSPHQQLRVRYHSIRHWPACH